MKRIRANSEAMQLLGTAVKKRRGALRLTQKALMRLSGCSLDFIVDLEHGRASRLDRILDVLKVLGVGFTLSEAAVPLTILEDLR